VKVLPNSNTLSQNTHNFQCCKSIATMTAEIPSNGEEDSTAGACENHDVNNRALSADLSLTTEKHHAPGPSSGGATDVQALLQKSGSGLRNSLPGAAKAIG
jgi:hypothetical protein